MSKIKWDIRREGRAWKGDEFEARWNLFPEKMEVYDGKIFWTDQDRLNMLAILLENVGVDKAVRLGDPKVSKAAVKELP